MATPKTKPALLSLTTLRHVRAWNAGQSWHQETLVEIGGHKLRVHMVRNTHDNQSSARCSVWSTPKMDWSQVSSLDISLWSDKARKVSYTDKALSASYFEAEVDTLLADARFVLGV